jgi:starch synthase (maltosyl-transferring)
MIVNLDANSRQSGYVQLPLDRLKINGRVNVKAHDIITDDHYTWTQEWNYVELDPYAMPFHLFKLEVHESYM